MTNYERRIKRIKDALLDLGPVLPGSISTQWNVCGKPNCQCKDKKKPKKHGPYYQLSFTLDGKSSSLFIKKQLIGEVKKCQKRFQRFRKLNSELLQAYVQWARNNGLPNTTKE